MKWIGGFFLGLLAVSLPQAQESFGGVLKRIQEQRAVYIAYRDNLPPLSYVDEQRGLWGYIPEVCALVVAKLGQRLGVGDLRLVPVPSSVAMGIYANNGVDLDCSGALNSAQKFRQMTYSYHVYVAGIRALVRKDSRVRSLDDLVGRQVVTVSGSGYEKYVKTRAALKNIVLRHARAASNEEALAQLASGEVDAFVSDDLTMMAHLVRMKDRESYGLLKEPLAGEPYGIGLPSGDLQLKQWVDEALVSLMQSGELESIYGKWFLNPVPVLGINYRVPMNEMLKSYFRTPSDKGL